MKGKHTLLSFAIVGLILAVGAFVIGNLISFRSEAVTDDENTYNDLYICSMHPWEASEGPNTCSICGMNLSRVEGHTSGNPLPEIDNLYVSESNPRYIHEGPGKDPDDGATLIPIKDSPFYQSKEKVSAKNARNHEAEESTEKMLWTCGMHPEVISEEPGICPICHMELIPVKVSTSVGRGLVVEIDPLTLQNMGVTTEKVERRDLSIEIRSNGVVKVAEDAEVKVNARVSGWVEKLYVNRTGESVTKGQPLLELYSPELVSAQEEYLLALESAAALKNSGLDLTTAAKRRLELWDISRDQIEALERSRTVELTMTIISPARGIVLHKSVIEGSAVKPGMDLFYIADLNTIWVNAQVYEYELPWVNIGDEVEIRSAYDPSLKAYGKVDYIYPTLNAKSRTAEVRIVLQNPRLRLKPEMYVDVNILTEPKTGVVSVSKQAVIRSGERDIVFIALGEGRFEPREVHLGIETERCYEILHNLQAGEVVVTSAQFLLDSEVKLQEAIQRRLNLQKKITSGNGKIPDEPESSAHQGHLH